MKRRFPSELAYVFGILGLALGTALQERADLGMSMIVAPAYLLHLKLSQVWQWYTFGVSEYLLQGALIAALAIIMQRFRRGYLFSFVTAVIYGLVLDAIMTLLAPIPVIGLPSRLTCYALGLLSCALGVAMVFHTYIAPEAYELFVKEIAEKTGAEVGIVKTIYDFSSCLLAVLLSFAFFGRLTAIGPGTAFCVLVNGWLIGRFNALLLRHFEFTDALSLRKYFE